jgi:hypothetical protein
MTLDEIKETSRLLMRANEDFIMGRWSLISVFSFKSVAIPRVFSHADSFCGVQISWRRIFILLLPSDLRLGDRLNVKRVSPDAFQFRGV